MPPEGGVERGVGWPSATARLLGATAAGLGATVLVGWHADVATLTRVSPAFVQMQYNTALGFVLVGAGLILAPAGRKRSVTATGVALVLLGGLTLLEYALRIDIGLDELFWSHPQDELTSHPGRMAPNTALCFLLSGFAQLALVAGRRHRAATVATIGSAVVGLGAVALTGYLAGVESAYGWSNLTRMAVHTAAGFVVSGVGLLAAAWWLHGAPGTSQHGLPAWVALPVWCWGAPRPSASGRP